MKATSSSKCPAPDEPQMKKHVKKSRLEDKVTKIDGKYGAEEGGDTEQEDSIDKYEHMRAEAEADCPVKGEFVMSRRNEKNTKVCAQNTSTTIYNLSTTSSRGSEMNHLFHK